MNIDIKPSLKQKVVKGAVWTLLEKLGAQLAWFIVTLSILMSMITRKQTTILYIPLVGGRQ